MFKDLKIDMPALLALLILSYFGIALAVSAWRGDTSPDLLRTLIDVVMLAVGYFLGSSMGSKSKDAVIAATATPPEPPHA